ncbi:hypothetical protein RF55_22597 [Lasius niger]|uniref:SAP domain-containing protein n=1 Tax=Lasius niger TaxID=67767 RepID=A0A0J7JWS1_LASNI|nr:hypothetical protein RF55_22597 [Lasius niger]
MRETLREEGLTLGGSKAELIQRLNEHDPSVWERLSEQRRQAARSGDVSVSGVARSPSERNDAVEGMETVDGTPRRGDQASLTAPGPRECGDVTQTELLLLRREREILEREQQLLRREIELMRSASTTMTMTSGSVVSTFVGVRGIKELLPEFDATDGTFWRWKQQLELLRRTYRLDDKSTKVLISSRLRGRALSWFYSRAEHVTLDLEDLLREMELMFDLRPGKLSLRREFEYRV